MKFEEFINKFYDIVDPKRQLSNDDIIKLVDEKFKDTPLVCSICNSDHGVSTVNVCYRCFDFDRE